MAKTPYNHGGRFKHAGACADECIAVIETQLARLKAQRATFDGIPRGGEANRLNDFARNLHGFTSNLVHFLEHAGAPAGTP